jgi:hypothetical protein
MIRERYHFPVDLRGPSAESGKHGKEGFSPWGGWPVRAGLLLLWLWFRFWQREISSHFCLGDRFVCVCVIACGRDCM